MKKKGRRKMPRYVSVKSKVGAGGRRFKGKTARSLSAIMSAITGVYPGK